MIGFLLPAAAALAVLAGLPLLIHRLTRRRARPVAFPAAALLARATAGLARRDRLRERTILAVRTAALLCAILAAAGPLMAGFGSSARPAAIILDASCSMRQVADGSTAFARGRAAAARLAGSLSPRPLLAVVAGGTAVRSSAAPLAAPGPAQALLADAQPGFGDGDLPGAIALALRSLDGPGDIFVVGDGARASLAGVDAAGLPDGVVLHLVDAGGGGSNRGVVAIAADPGVAIAGRPLQLRTRVANYGPAPERIPVRISCGAQARTAELDVPAGGSAVLELTLTPSDAGWIAASVEIPGGDALAEDDRRDAAVQVLPGLAAVVAGDGARGDPAGALRPLVAGLEAAGFDVTLTDGAGLAGGAARAAALVATAGLRDAAAAPALGAHLAAGGTWLQVLAGDGDASLRPGGAEPPAMPGTRIDLAADGHPPATIARARLEHPLFEPFTGRESLLAEITALRLRSTPGGVSAGAEALASWSDGNVALAERRLGQGRWLMLNASTAGADGALARSEAWPLLCGRLAALCSAPRSEDAAGAPGMPIAAAWLADPAGARSEAVDGRVRPDRPGLWRGDAGRILAVAVPAGESDLRRLDGARATATAADEVLARSQRRPLWPWLLAAAAVLLGLELLLAGPLARRTTS